MNFTIIDIKTWKRKEYFEHYYSNVPCTYSMNVKLDITKINKQKLYPTMLYCITTIVNKHPEFRTAFNNEGNLGVYDTLIPSYTIFNQDTETFSNLWTEYFEKYADFCTAYEKDLAKFGQITKMVAKPNPPENTFPISMIPWTSFEGFNLNLKEGYNYLLPIFTIGKYYEEAGKYILPFSIQVHHAICDGFHTCRFINELQEIINNFSVNP